MINWIQRLCKWRSIFAGWQLGTRSNSDPECQAVRDHREVTMILRAEVNALTHLLANKSRTFTIQEFGSQVQKEAEWLCSEYEKRFPGCRASDEGMVFDSRAVETMKNWKP
jgi:hypothetical protein